MTYDNTSPPSNRKFDDRRGGFRHHHRDFEHRKAEETRGHFVRGEIRARDVSEETPVETGKEYDVLITDTSRQGDGIARVDGFIIFVKGGEPGQKAKIKVTQVGRRFAVGRAMSVASRSLDTSRFKSTQRKDAVREHLLAKNFFENTDELDEFMKKSKDTINKVLELDKKISGF